MRRPTTMIRVAHVITIYRGAVGILEPKLLALDAYDDIEVTIITPPKPDDLDLPDPRIRHRVVDMVRPIRPLADLRSIRAMYSLFRHEQFDIVHTHSSKAGVVGAIAASLARVPRIYHTFHGMPFYEGQNARQFRRYQRFERFACRFRHHVFSQNRRDVAACLELMGGDGSKVSYEGNGVDPDDVARRANEHRDGAASEFPPGALRILMVSRLEPVKRVDDFLRACAALVRDGVDISAVVAGYGPLEQELKRQAADAGLAERIRFIGWVLHAPALMAACDVAVLTSQKEGIPRSLIEAMSLGKPVVATDVLGTQELVVDGETGFLTPFGDPEALAARVRLFGEDTALRQRMGQAGRLRVLDHFNDVKIAAFLRQFYISGQEQHVAAV